MCGSSGQVLEHLDGDAVLADGQRQAGDAGAFDARMPDAWDARNCRQVGEVRRGAGPNPAAARIRRIVPSPIESSV
jgi:hypothetical protein